ncbi:MAG: WGR domain-containing protein [Campylobacterales bacterium]|nr:WGR domain-containing protein [Campylobacterales bacterium]
MYKQTLTRKVGNRIRYYTLDLQMDLFGEYIVNKIFGSICNKKPTGFKREYFQTRESAIISFKRNLALKMAKGYKLL